MTPETQNPKPETRPPHWLPEQWDLVRFCRGTLEPPHLDERTVQAIGQTEFWEPTLRIPALQPLLPVLYWRLHDSELLPRVPNEVRHILKSHYYVALLWADRLSAMLQPILDALRREHIPVILLKGMALASEIYNNAALRPMVDLDLLVRREHLGAVRRILHDLGYRLSPNPAGHPEQFDEMYGGELEFYVCDGQGGMAVDLHVHLFAIEWYRRATRLGDVDKLWAEARPLPAFGENVWQLSPEDTLIALCVHMAVPEGFWGTIRRLLDIDWLVRRSAPPLDWDRLIARTRDFRVRMPVLICLELSERVFDTPVPAAEVSRLDVPNWRRSLVHRLVDGQLGPSPTPIGRRAKYLLQLLLVDDVRAVAAMLRHVFFPGRRWLASRYALRSPARAFAYQLVHPLRVIGLGLASLWQTRLVTSNTDTLEEVRWN
jgi:hypothetical protein